MKIFTKYYKSVILLFIICVTCFFLIEYLLKKDRILLYFNKNNTEYVSKKRIAHLRNNEPLGLVTVKTINIIPIKDDNPRMAIGLEFAADNLQDVSQFRLKFGDGTLLQAASVEKINSNVSGVFLYTNWYSFNLSSFKKSDQIMICSNRHKCNLIFDEAEMQHIGRMVTKFISDPAPTKPMVKAFVQEW